MSAPVPQQLESLRRQLEGRWEHIEQARERYTQLTRQLSSFHWQSALRSQPELLKETREQEAELSEVLTYVEHRASREQWPREHPGLRVLQELRELRAELEALAHKRLAQSALQSGASLAEALGGLEALALAPLPRPPGEDEPVLFEDRMLSWPSPGRVWLTPKRLLWQPRFGEPVQLPLSSLEPEAITLLPGWIGVRVKRVGLTLFSLSYAETLASLLRLGIRLSHRRHEQPQVHEVVTHLAYCPQGDMEKPRRWGLGVFGPHGVALLPARHRTLLDLCRNLVGLGARRPQPSELRRLEAVVEHLRLLPPGEFAQALRELTQARGGRFWPSTERPLRGLTGQDVTLQAGKQRLVVSQPEHAVRQFLDRLPPASARPPKRSWWRKNKVRLCIAAGLALYYMAAVGDGVNQPLGYAGWAFFAWACMSYSKDKGYTVLPGLLLSILFPLFACFPLVFVFMLGTPKEE